MSSRITRSLSGVCLAVALLSSAAAYAQTTVEHVDGGIVKVRSAYSVDETIARLEKDIAGKGIIFFIAVDQAKLAADAGIKLRASTLLVFGNPALGAQFITSNPQAGLDWPVRLLVSQDEAGMVWATYTDFAWIARRHHITDRDEQFRKASSVVESITSSVAVK